MNRTLKIIIGVIAGIILLPAVLIGLQIRQLFKGPSPQTFPAIKYGEFPFKLVYEVNGERVTVEDTLICEYDGTSWNEGMGKQREWKSYFKSNNEENHILLLELEDQTKIYYTTGKAKHHMGDGKRVSYEKDPFNAVYADGPSRSKLHHMGTENMLEYLNIVLIEWEIAPPIVNEFK